VKYGNIFSIDAGPNYEGRLRDIDVQTLRKVGEMIKHAPLPGLTPLSEGKPAKASSVWNAPGYEADKAFDGDEHTRWGAAPDSRSGWLEVDLGAEQRIGRAEIIETFHRTQEFALEYKQGDAWKELYHGSAIESGKPIEFAPVRARYVRLNILRAGEVPTIEELQIMNPAK
jgi:alpha-L-fucosidase